MTEVLANRIIDYREDSPFEDPPDVLLAGIELSIANTFMGRTTVKSSYFRITSTSTVNEITRIIESVMDTSMKIYFWREG
jgi:hypothetical protein